MTLLTPDGLNFCTGSCPYFDQLPSSETETPKIYIQVSIEGQQVLSAVDTGGAYLLCDPQLMEIIELSPNESVGSVELKTAHGNFSGSLYRLELGFLADNGFGTTIEATAFFPDLQENDKWPFPPAILGYFCCLERLRFAVGPENNHNRFHFGSI